MELSLEKGAAKIGKLKSGKGKRGVEGGRRRQEGDIYDSIFLFSFSLAFVTVILTLFVPRSI